MPLGLLDRLRGRSAEKPSDEKRAYSLAEAIDVSKQRLASVDYSRGGEMVEKIRKSVSRARQDLRRLADAPLDPAMDKRLYSAARESRQQLVLRLQHMLDSIDLPSEATYQSLDRLRKSLAAGLSQITYGNLKHSFYTATVFKKEMAALGESLTVIEHEHRELSEYLNSSSKSLASYRNLLDAVDAKEALESEIAALQKSLAGLQERRGAFKPEAAGPARAQSQEADEVASLESQRDEIESQIYSMIASLSKPMKKYEKIGNFEKPVAEAVRGYVDDPVRAALEDDGRRLPAILDDLKRLVESGQIELQGHAKEKALSMIERLKGNELGPPIRRHAELEARIAAAREKLKAVVGERSRAERETSKRREELMSLESEIGQLGRAIGEKTAELQKREADVARWLPQIS